MNKIKSRYRTEIDGLRGLAIIAVIIYHFNKEIIPSGFLGVDIFFVISGYVFIASFFNKANSSLKDLLLLFYSKRIKRLIPALLVCVAITSVLICCFNPQPELHLKTGIASLFGFSNLYLLQRTTDYFGASAELNPFTQTWYLGVDIQFYLIFPTIIWLFYFSKKSISGMKSLLFVLGILTTSSLILFIYLSNTNLSAAYFLTSARFWEISFGSLLYLGATLNRPLFSLLSKRISPNLLILLIIVAFFAPIELSMQVIIISVVLTAALINSIKPGTFAYKCLSNPKMVWIGTLSYSLYLWHWSVIVISRWTIGIHWWSIPIQVALTFLLAIASYNYVERPFRRAKWSNFYSLTIGYGIVASAVSALLIFALGKSSSLKQAIYLGSELPFRSNLNTVRSEIKGCNIFNDMEAISLSPKCGSVVDKSKPTIFLVGDSHMAQFVNSIMLYAKNHQINVISVYGNACSFPSSTMRRGEKQCFELQSMVEKSLVENVKNGDIVIMGNALYNRFSGDGKSENVYFTQDNSKIERQEALSIYISRLKSLVATLESKGVLSILYLDGAHFPDKSKAMNCSIEWFRPAIDQNCIKNKSEFLAFRQPIEDGLETIARDSQAIIWDGMDDYTCQDDNCYGTFYIDDNHFHYKYAEYIVEKFFDSNRQLFDSTN